MSKIKETPALDFWTQLYCRGQHLSETRVAPAYAHNMVVGQMTALIETYDNHFDPAEQFEQFAVITFCKAVLLNLEFIHAATDQS